MSLRRLFGFLAVGSAAVVMTGGLGATSAAAVTPCEAAGGTYSFDAATQTSTCTFGTPSSAAVPSYSFAIPAEASSVQVVTSGSAGGGSAAVPGGKGAAASATYGSLAGANLSVVVGALGGRLQGGVSGGFPDGGDGGVQGPLSNRIDVNLGYGGGGSSSVQRVGGPLLVVAGGGGGSAGGAGSGALGGAGGNAGTGGSGQTGNLYTGQGGAAHPGGAGGASPLSATSGVGGLGAPLTQSSCGTGSNGGAGGNGGNAAPGAGGAGGYYGPANTSAGGGGGGGFAGGGGGAGGAGGCTGASGSGGGGGGGGSSAVLANPTTSNILDGPNAPNTGPGSVSISYTVTPAPTVSAFAAPALLQKSPFGVTFSVPVKGVNTSDLTVVEVGSISVAGAVTCRDPANTAVSCLTGPVLTALFTPSKPLIAGEYYFVNVNPTSSGVVAYADSKPVPTTQGYVRAQSTLTAFDYPVKFTWAKVVNAAARGGSYVQNNSAGQTETFTATGSSLGIITWNGPDGGTATVTVTTPGQPTVTRVIDTYAATAGGITTTISGLPTGTHTLTVSVDGAHNPASTGTWVRVDAMVVAGVVKNTPALTASVWPNFPGDYAYTGAKNSTVSLRFRGTGIVWTALVGPNNGRAKVSIDGVVKAAAQDLYAPGYVDQTFTFNGLADGFHTIVITCLGTKQAASSDSIVTLVALTVQ